MNCSESHDMSSKNYPKPVDPYEIHKIAKKHKEILVHRCEAPLDGFALPKIVMILEYDFAQNVTIWFEVRVGNTPLWPSCSDMHGAAKQYNEYVKDRKFK